MSRTLTLVLTLLALGLSAATPLVPTVAAQSTSSSACCGFPTDVVMLWTDLYPTIQGNPPDQNQTCRAICNQWYKTCTNMAGTSYRCFSSLFSNVSLIDLAECSTLQGSSRSNCQSSNRDQLESLIANLQSDNSEALGICSGSVGSCVNNCLE